MLDVSVQPRRWLLDDEEDSLVRWAGALATLIVPDEGFMPRKEEPQPPSELPEMRKSERTRGQVPAAQPQIDADRGQVIFPGSVPLQHRVDRLTQIVVAQDRELRELRADQRRTEQEEEQKLREKIAEQERKEQEERAAAERRRKEAEAKKERRRQDKAEAERRRRQRLGEQGRAQHAAYMRDRRQRLGEQGRAQHAADSRDRRARQRQAQAVTGEGNQPVLDAVAKQERRRQSKAESERRRRQRLGEQWRAQHAAYMRQWRFRRSQQGSG